VALVLTTSSSVSCDHPPQPGGGAVVLGGAVRGVLTIKGATVLSGSLANAPVDAGCAQKGPNQVPCATIAEQFAASTSTVLSVEGEPVLLDTAQGLTAQGAPDRSWSVKDAGHDLLRAD
jgi:hypothetical protein